MNDFYIEMGLRQKIANIIAGKKGLNFGSVGNIDNNAVMSFRFPNLEVRWGQYTDYNLTLLYHSIAEIYAPVTMIAAGVAGGYYTLKKKSDKSVVTDNKQMNALFDQPNPLQNWKEFVLQKEVYELITGKSYIYANIPDTMTVNYKNVSTLINLQADNVQIETRPVVKLLSATTIEDLILNFIAFNGNTSPLTIAPSRVLFTKHCSIDALDMSIRGRSRLLSDQMAIDNIIKVYEARNFIFGNRGALGIISSGGTDIAGNIPWTPDEKKEIQDEFKGYGVTNGKNPFIITNQHINYTNIGATIKDMEPFKETLACAEVFYATYDVPRDLMPKSEGATFENQNNAEKRLYNNVIIPRALSLCQSLTKFLKLDEAGYYIDVSFDHIPVLQENLKEKSGVDWRNNETFRVQFSFGLVTLNQWRVKYGYPLVTGKPIYDKLLFEMDETELAQVELIIRIASAVKTSGGGANATTEGTGGNADGNGN